MDKHARNIAKQGSKHNSKNCPPYHRSKYRPNFCLCPEYHPKNIFNVSHLGEQAVNGTKSRNIVYFSLLSAKNPSTAKKAANGKKKGKEAVKKLKRKYSARGLALLRKILYHLLLTLLILQK